MSMDSHIVKDDSKLSRFEVWFYQLEQSFAFLGGVAILLIVSLSVVNILGRWLFNLPVDGYIDWIEQAMAFIAFLGLAFVQRLGGHIRMDMVISRIKGRRLWIAELSASLLMLSISLILMYGSYLHFLRAFQLGDSSLDIELPTWPAKVVVPIAFLILSIRLVLQVIAYIKAIKNNETSPSGVPLADDNTGLS